MDSAGDVQFECWAWLSKRGDDYESIVYDAGKFKKRKKRWITVTETSLIYSKTTKKTDMKYVQLEHMTAIKTFNEANIERMVYLIDSQNRTVQVVLEPDNFTRDVPLLLSVLLGACTKKRRLLTQQAILANNIPELKSVLAYHTLSEAISQDVNFSTYGTPLHFVIHHPQCVECLPYLVDRDALVASPNAEGFMPVHSAVRVGSLAMIQRLVEVAAWPVEQGGGGVNPDFLVNLRTCSPTAPDNLKMEGECILERSPLHISTDEEVTALLLKYGARLDDKDSNGDTPFLLACRRGLYLHAVELLDAGANVNEANWSTGMTPIMYVIAHSDCGMKVADSAEEDDIQNLFLDLLDRGANCTVLDNTLMSPLHYACKRGDLSVCSALVQAGVELDVQSSSGATPLCLAASLQSSIPGSSSHELCGLLIAKGAYPRIRDQQGRQALHYAAAAGNFETLSLLLEVGQGQDVNAICFNGFSALDYVNYALSWLDDESALEKPPFIRESEIILKRGVSEKYYIQCQTVLKKFGAFERSNSNISVEQNCRDITFSSAKNGAYTVASATPYAAVLRLTSCLFYSKEEAEFLLLTYKSYISPIHLLNLLRIRFYCLVESTEKALTICEDGVYQLGVIFKEIDDIELLLTSLEIKSESVHNLSTSGNNNEGSTIASTLEESIDQEEIVAELQQQSLVRKRGDTILIKDSKNYIKGVDTAILPRDNDDEFKVKNTSIGKIHNGDESSILKKFLTCLAKCFDGLEVASNCLILRYSGRYFIMENVSLSRIFKTTTSWSVSLSDEGEKSTFRIPGITASQAPCNIKSISLWCKPAHKMMRGKAVFELTVTFSNTVPKTIQLDEDILSSLHDELCLLCAKIIFGFSNDAFSPDIPLLRTPRLLTSKSTIDILEEAAESQSRGEMEGLQSCLSQIIFLENELCQQQERTLKNASSASLTALLQLLALWCKEFYEDDFENDDACRFEMGQFVEEVFATCGDLIENEMDPNSFTSFLGLQKQEKSSLGFISEVDDQSHVNQRHDFKQNKRESKAIRQSKRLSSRGMIDAAPLLRGGMYESLYFFNQQSFFDENGVSLTRSSDFNILSSSPLVIAEQWTLIEHFLYSKVKLSDFLSKDEKSSGNLLRLKQFQWHMMDWSISQIIDSKDSDEVRLKLCFYLDIAKCMEGFRNFSGMFEVFTVLNTSSVFRLKDVWTTLDSAAVEKSRALNALFNSSESFSQYRKYILELKELHSQPILPYLGIYLKDLVHLKQLPTRVEDKQDLVNMTKMLSLSSKLMDLHTYQLVAYRFEPNFPLISNFFCRPKFKTEDEQFEGSCRLFPMS